MFYDVILSALAVAFPLIGCGLFVLFWKLLRDDAAPDPIYRSSFYHSSFSANFPINRR
jgi:hypothetical protein